MINFRDIFRLRCNRLKQPKYIRLVDGDPFPEINDFSPFIAVVIIETPVSVNWQTKASKWLVDQGCLFMLAWGLECSSWDDSVDIANLEDFDYGDVPDDRFVMTTWHENEPLTDVIEFAVRSAWHDTQDLENFIFFHISDNCRQDEFTKLYAEFI